MGQTRHLVLGAAGFLGAALTGQLAERGETVVAAGRRFLKGGASHGVERVVSDLYRMTQDELDMLVAGSMVIHHLAWSNLPAAAEADPTGDHADNVGFVVRLLSAVRRSGGLLVLCSSGGTVYGRCGAALISEDAPLRPVGAYGAAKAAAEIYAGLFRDGYGCDVRVARLSNPYGRGQQPERLQGALSRFARQAAVGEEIEIWGDGSVVRDYIHISDAIAGLLAVADAPRETLADSATFNIGSGTGASLNDLIALLSARLRRPVAVRYRAARALDVPRNILSIDRARERLGWSPRVSLDHGIALLLDEIAS